MQIRNVARTQATTIVVNKCKVLKLDYPEPVLQNWTGYIIGAGQNVIAHLDNVEHQYYGREIL